MTVDPHPHPGGHDGSPPSGGAPGSGGENGPALATGRRARVPRRPPTPAGEETRGGGAGVTSACRCACARCLLPPLPRAAGACPARSRRHLAGPQYRGVMQYPSGMLCGRHLARLLYRSVTLYRRHLARHRAPPPRDRLCRRRLAGLPPPPQRCAGGQSPRCVSGSAARPPSPHPRPRPLHRGERLGVLRRGSHGPAGSPRSPCAVAAPPASREATACGAPGTAVPARPRHFAFLCGFHREQVLVKRNGRFPSTNGRAGASAEGRAEPRTAGKRSSAARAAAPRPAALSPPLGSGPSCSLRRSGGTVSPFASGSKFLILEGQCLPSSPEDKPFALLSCELLLYKNTNK